MAKKKDRPKPERPKPKREMQTKNTEAGMAWSCKRCGTTGITVAGNAQVQFDAHKCTE